MISWLILTAALPTSPSALRVRIWRALKATACATLREGVYILPAQAPTAGDLRALERAIQDAGASAHLLELQARDAAQEKTFRALFDRSAAFADFALALKETRQALRSTPEAELRKRLRGLEQQLDALLATDYFPGKAGPAAVAGLQTLRAELDRRFSPGEPRAAEGAVPRLERTDFQGRTWATRRRPWVDRLATAWLVQRFIDRQPRFLWLADAGKCPKGALGFDFDGARFSHVGTLVTFEVVARAFGLDADPAIQRIGQLVHCVDVGGIPVDEAAGLETLVRGLQAQHRDDDALLAAACSIFDTLHAAWRTTA
jgi:hypothetical protein